MKKLFIVAVALLATSSAWAQGKLTFANAGAGVNAPDNVVLNNTTAPASGPVYAAQLYVAAAGTTDLSQFVAVGAPVTYLTATSAGYFTGGEYIIPNFAGGTTVATQVRAFNTTQGSTFATASAAPLAQVGYSNIVPVTLTSGTTTGPNMIGLQSFNIAVVPEPSTIALGVIGAAALLLRRRRA